MVRVPKRFDYVCVLKNASGTGKSAVIKAICREIDHASPNDQTYQILAPTGAAAINVDGKTIHSFLNISINGVMMPLQGDQLRNHQIRMRCIEFIIIDEYSMIGVGLLAKIHRCLCEACGEADELFGGFNIYVFGDISQQPPVRDTPFYGERKDDFSRLGLSLVNGIQRFITLSVCHIQATDQMQFKQALDNLASGKSTQRDWELFMTRESVAKGFSQLYGVDFLETYSPVVLIASTRLILAHAAKEKLLVRQFDIKTAFLYGRLDDVIYMTPPEGYAKDNNVWLLKRSLYGLRQAPRMWNMHLDQVISKLGLRMSQHDNSLFYQHDPIIIYVDDGLIFARQSSDIDRVANKGSLTWMTLGSE